MQQLRLVQGLSQTDLAHLVSVTPGAISRFETGQCQPSARTTLALAGALHVPVTFLLDRDAVLVEAAEAVHRAATER